ncbi:hypothetical protein EfmJHP35_19940 [Enterococcus faecium]|nr:hypothetical protein EfmJHP35_19940 [Enterococcus faecium]
MKRRGLTSTYTIAHFKGQRTACNEAKTANVLDRTFTQEQPLEAIVTDLTYVRVRKKWHYICLILDLFNREIIGYSLISCFDNGLDFQIVVWKAASSSFITVFY